METTTKEFKQVKNTENGISCILDKDHSDQQNYRASCAIWLCVPAIAKIQAKLGINADTTNQNRLFILMAKKLGVDIDINDLNRNKTALENKTAKADTTDLNINDALFAYITKQFKADFTRDEIKSALIASLDLKLTEQEKAEKIAIIEKHIKHIENLQTQKALFVDVPKF